MSLTKKTEIKEPNCIQELKDLLNFGERKFILGGCKSLILDKNIDKDVKFVCRLYKIEEKLYKDYIIIDKKESDSGEIIQKNGAKFHTSNDQMLSGKAYEDNKKIWEEAGL